MNYLIHLSVLIALALTSELNAQVDNCRMYIYGHSLIDHALSPDTNLTHETTIPHWMGVFAEADANHTYAVSGQYGFLTSHDDGPPSDNWGYSTVDDAWDGTMETFAEADFNTVLLTPANFVQDPLPHEPHPLDPSTSVVTSTAQILDWVEMQGDDPTYYIYGHWPEMDLASAYPPTLPLESEVEEFHTQTLGSHDAWFKLYQDSMLVRWPDYDVRLIPAGQMISKVLTEVIPDAIPFDSLYEDSAPHGYTNVYFLAAMATYMAVYQEPTPAAVDAGPFIHNAIRDNYIEIRDTMWEYLQDFNLPNGDSRVFIEEQTTYVDNIALDNDAISFVPNPNDGQFSITGLLNDYHINILDNMGNVTQSIDTNGQTEIDIDLISLTSGIYFIQVLNKTNQSLWIERVIKM